MPSGSLAPPAPRNGSSVTKRWEILERDSEDTHGQIHQGGAKLRLNQQEYPKPIHLSLSLAVYSKVLDKRSINTGRTKYIRYAWA